MIILLTYFVVKELFCLFHVHSTTFSHWPFVAYALYIVRYAQITRVKEEGDKKDLKRAQKAQKKDENRWNFISRRQKGSLRSSTCHLRSLISSPSLFSILSHFFPSFWAMKSATEAAIMFPERGRDDIMRITVTSWTTFPPSHTRQLAHTTRRRA